MKIERINNWLTLLGNTGIIISIIFLAYQISEANRVSSAQAYQTRAQMGAEITWTLADSDNLAPIVARVYGGGPFVGSFQNLDLIDELNELERFRLLVFERSAITLYENNLYQCGMEFLDPAFCDYVRESVALRIPYWKNVFGGEIPGAYIHVRQAAEIESD